MKPTTILIAEDDLHLQRGLIDLLEAEGYRVLAASDGMAALELLEQEHPDLALLDVMMPRLSGYEVCRAIRKRDTRLPVIMLTAKGEEIDKVVGLELGADDYITKPFGLHELRARIAAVLRRSRPLAAPLAEKMPPTFLFGAVEIDRRAYQVHRNGESLSLSARELKLLETFYARPGQVLSRQELLNQVWGIDYFGTTRTLDQHVAQLRKKIEVDPATPVVIATVHGVGYRFDPPPAA
jgi:DNA-binding response OmpR family regulator